MSNLNKTNLDANQITVNSYDGVQEAQRTTVVSAVDLNVNVSESSGDSVVSYNGTSDVVSFSVNSGGPPIPSISGVLFCSKYAKCSVYSEIGDAPATPGSVKIQVSYKESGNAAIDWHDLSPAILAGYSPQGTNLYPAQNVGLSAVYEFCAKRIRLVSVVKPSTAFVSYTLLLRT